MAAEALSMPLEQTNDLNWLAGYAPVCTSHSDG